MPRWKMQTLPRYLHAFGLALLPVPSPMSSVSASFQGPPQGHAVALPYMYAPLAVSVSAVCLWVWGQGGSSRVARQGPESYGLGDSSWLSPRVTGFPDEGRRPQGDSALVGLSQRTWDKGWVASRVRALELGS